MLLFLDGHCNPEPGSIERLVDDVERTDGEAIITPAIPGLDAARWKNLSGQVGHGYRLDLETFDVGWLPLASLRKVRRAGRDFYESPAGIGCAVAIHGQLYDGLRGFDPQMRIWGVEDMDLSLKCWLMGHPILHDPAAIIGHRFRQTFDNYDVPVEHVLVNKLRTAYKNYTSSVWADWLDRCRRQHSGRLAEHPEGLWARAWTMFEDDRASAEMERGYLLSRRTRDEFWYAERFGLDWPGASTSSMQLLSASHGEQPLEIQASPSPSPSPAPTRTIFISGYWPPTNIEQPDGMLKQLKDLANSRGTYGEYVVDRYHPNYKLVVIATEFPGLGGYTPGVEKDWKGGMGFWQVDYLLTSYTFWKLMEKYTPFAVMTTSRNQNDKKWVLEIGAKNLARANWTTEQAWNDDRPPYIGGSDIDPAKLWGPNAGEAPEDGFPPDATRAADPVAGAKVGREITDSVKDIQAEIITRLDAEFAPGELVAEPDDEFQGIPDDNYVSAFAGYHALWYDASVAGCFAAWHTHVGYGITAAHASDAIKYQLEELMSWLDLHVPY